MRTSLLEKIFVAHHDRLLRDLTKYATAICAGDPGYPPEDIAADAMVIALEQRAALEQKRIASNFWRLRNFLRRVAANLARNHLRIRCHRTAAHVLDETAIVRTAIARSSDATWAAAQIVEVEEHHPILRRVTILAIAEDRPARTG